jgi:hypothetical protein
MSEPEFKDKFIGFVDILGFKEMVKAAEAGTGVRLSELLENTKALGTPDDRKLLEKIGPTVCPDSAHVQRDLDFQLTQVSDCVIVSTEVSPAGVINLVNHCWGSVIKLLSKGIMCRGYLTRGLIYHTDTQFIGSGYHEAYSKEAQVVAFKREADERGTPFVQVDQVICDYVRDKGDRCVKEMFSRYVKGDKEVTVLFPFQRLQHSFIIGPNAIDATKERTGNQNTRLTIENFKKRVMGFVDQSNPAAIRKAEYYIAALDAQLEVCKWTDEIIDMISPRLS